MRRLSISELDAFRRLLQQSHAAGATLGKTASKVLRAEELLFKGTNLPRSLPSMLAAIRRGLKSSPDAQRARVAGRSSLAAPAHAPLPFPSR